MKNISSYIDHTLLKATASEQDIWRLCQEAIQYQFCSVCIQPFWVAFAKKTLEKSGVKVCTVVGFPLGANDTHIKIIETQEAIKAGADEIDMVINLGAVKSKQWELVGKEIRGIVRAAQPHLVKVILETCYLDEAEKIQASQIAIESGAEFIKTSTGFGTAGASIADVMLMKKIAQNKGVKASGGIKNTTDALAMIQAGATRIGTSNGIVIVNPQQHNSIDTY